MAKALLAHSGGPTAVINASLLGLVERATEAREINGFLGARFGIAGAIREDFIDLAAQGRETLEAVARTPSSALGTSRHEMEAADLGRLIEIFRKHDIRYFFYNGGNGSMRTAHQVSEFAVGAGYELAVIGIPKTIDNDLMGTDHTPGFPSTARFFVSAVRDVDSDNRALPGQVEVIEVLGRNTGWLVGATALLRKDRDDAPHLIYFPEENLPLDVLLGDVEEVFTRLNRCVIAVCEGQLDNHGQPFGADVRRGSLGSLAMNLGHKLAMLITQHLSLRSRSEKPGLLGRSTSWTVVPHDWEEARLCGRAAWEAAIGGKSGQMVTLIREPGLPYRTTTGLIPLQAVAQSQRCVPAEWRLTNGLAPAFEEYLRPLVGEIENFPRLKSGSSRMVAPA